MEINNIWTAEAFTGNAPVHKTLAEKVYTANNGDTATAVIEALADPATGEIMNAVISVKKSIGDIVYLPKDYQEGRKWAQQLVEHWNDGDLKWEPAQGYINGEPVSE